MIERVQKDWMEGVLAAARDERRKYDRKASDYESARWGRGLRAGVRWLGATLSP
jgi:hypothetical protein